MRRATVTRESVSPRYLRVTLLINAALVLLAIIGLLLGAVLSGVWIPYPVAGAVAVAGTIWLATEPRRVGAIRFELRVDDLLFERGVLFQRTVAVPYGRMQLVDVSRGPIERAAGLAQLKLVTASTSTALTIPGLPAERAAILRDQLIALAESRRVGV